MSKLEKKRNSWIWNVLAHLAAECDFMDMSSVECRTDHCQFQGCQDGNR